MIGVRKAYKMPQKGLGMVERGPTSTLQGSLFKFTLNKYIKKKQTKNFNMKKGKLQISFQIWQQQTKLS